MEVIYKEEVLHLEYTFNSFKYMEELDLEELNDLDRKPFKAFRIAETLLLGAVNNNPKSKYSLIQVSEIIEEVVNDGKLMELLEHLIDLLQESSFFKSLQK